ncbi:Protein transport protein sft2 [Durusdinium trenchii]|uniref:Vesicle transport protein n=1 Tax=Durusdinium trenchii TaxID=1381693 RepID=A0ABP0I0C3_9DINO
MASQTPSSQAENAGPLDRLKLGFKGFTKGFSTPVVDQEAPPAEIEEQSGPSTNMFSSWAEKARKAFNEVTYDPVPKEETPEAIPDEEKGEGAWANFSKAASRLSKSVASAAEEAKQNLEKAAEKAKSADLAQQVQDFQSGVAKGLGAAADRASQAREVFAERGKAASAIAKDLGSKAANKATEAKSHAASKAKEAKDKAASVAGAAKDKLAQAGEGLKGLGNLALSPAKLAQFAGTFLAGVFLISLSLNFLPVMVIAPQKFALLFAFGSMTMLGSFALLKGPKAFLSGMARKEQLPFSVAYGVGLVGTLVATIILRSFLLTGICGLLQAVGLLYFVASYVPGGKACVNFVGRMCSKATTALLCRR